MDTLARLGSGRGSELAGAMKEKEWFVSYLLKIYLGWTSELLMFNLSLYQNTATVQTIAQLKLLDYLLLKHYLILAFCFVKPLKIIACFSLSSPYNLKEAAIRRGCAAAF